MLIHLYCNWLQKLWNMAESLILTFNLLLVIRFNQQFFIIHFKGRWGSDGGGGTLTNNYLLATICMNKACTVCITLFLFPLSFLLCAPSFNFPCGLTTFAGIVYAQLFCTCNACHFHHTWAVFVQQQSAITDNLAMHGLPHSLSPNCFILFYISGIRFS